jgi:hypothetical protein
MGAPGVAAGAMPAAWGSPPLPLKPSAAAEALKRTLPVTINSSSRRLPMTWHFTICQSKISTSIRVGVQACLQTPLLSTNIYVTQYKNAASWVT